MKIWFKLLGLSAAGLLHATAGAADCLNYQPAVVSVTGLLHRATFPGPPNFESVAGGDTPETGYYLTLNTPVCTRGDGDVEHEPHDGVKEIQLVLDKSQYDLLRPSLGKQVELRGQLFSSFTGHHHADVLLRVTR